MKSGNGRKDSVTSDFKSQDIGNQRIPRKENWELRGKSLPDNLGEYEKYTPPVDNEEPGVSNKADDPTCYENFNDPELKSDVQM